MTSHRRFAVAAIVGCTVLAGLTAFIVPAVQNARLAAQRSSDR